MAYNVQSMNKVILLGRLGQDPNLSYLESGTAKCEFSVATSEKWKDNAGEFKEKIEWHNCIAWAKTAEIAGKWAKKGQLVLVEGKNTTRKWEKDGVKHQRTEITVDQFQMIGKSGEVQQPASQDNPNPPPIDDNDDDDLPF